jgi:hypothetical protein
MLNYKSAYLEHAGRTLNWLPMDTEELYKQNLKNRYDELAKNGWIDNPFTYKFNSLGFRCEEFTQDPTIMFLGCSCTVGIGLPQEFIWPEIVSKELKMQCANFGIGGGSCDTAFRMCHGYIDKIRPKLVIFMPPPGARLELLNFDSIQNFVLSTSVDDLFLKKWTADQNNNWFNKKKNILATRMICEDRGIKFIETTDQLLYPASGWDLARDLLHPGISAHANVASRLLEIINGSVKSGLNDTMKIWSGVRESNS